MRSTRPHLPVMIITAILLALVPGRSHGDSPPQQTVAHWNGTCVESDHWTYDTENLVKQTLPNELIAGSAHINALRANATIIRQDSWYYHNHPEGPPGTTIPFCAGVSYQYDWRDSKMEFHVGTGYSTTNAATNDTWGYGWYSNTTSANNLTFDPWGNLMQDETVALAEQGYGWVSIVGSDSYPPGQFGENSPPETGTNDLAPLTFVCLYNDGTCDSDGDGYGDTRDATIGTSPVGRCGVGALPEPSTKWPSDLRSGSGTAAPSTDRVTIQDFNSFIVPLRPDGSRNKFDHTVPDPLDPNIRRWDLVPGGGPTINIADVNAIYTSVTGYPPMFDAAWAGSGIPCSAHPVYGD